MCWTYTYGMYTTRTLTRKTLHGWLPTCYSSWERLSQTKMSSESSAVKTAAFLLICVFFFLFFGRPLQKRKKNRESLKKKILILDRCVTFVNETYRVPLCTTMLIYSTKPIHCGKMSTSTLVFILYLDWAWNISSCWKSACCFQNTIFSVLKSKYKI